MVSPVGSCACPEAFGPREQGRWLRSVHAASRGSSPSVLLSPLHQGEYKQTPSPEDTSFMAELEELRKAFLKRPGCPQFSTKATSMSRYGESHPRGGPHKETTSLPGGVGRPSWCSSARVVASGGNSLCMQKHQLEHAARPVQGGQAGRKSLLAFLLSHSPDSVGLGVGEREKAQNSRSCSKEVMRPKIGTNPSKEPNHPQV